MEGMVPVSGSIPFGELSGWKHLIVRDLAPAAMKISRLICSSLSPELRVWDGPPQPQQDSAGLGSQARGTRGPVAAAIQPLPKGRGRQRGIATDGEPNLRVAVAGAGAFGRNHLRVYRELETAGQGVALVAAIEPDGARAVETASKYALPVFASVEEMLAADLRVDAASVAVPTVHHHAVASALLEAGLDVLVEKPLAASLQEADELLELASRHRRILQPGHLERFNPAVLAVETQLRRPMFFEAHRLSVFTPGHWMWTWCWT